MAVIGAIGAFLGQVAEAVESVGHALLETLGWLIDFLSNFLAAAFNSVITTLETLIEGFAQQVADVILLAVGDFETTGTISDTTIDATEEVLFGTVFQILVGTAVIFMILLALLTPFTFSFGFILGFVVGAIAGLWLSSVFARDAPQDRARPDLDPSMPLSTMVEVVRSLIESSSSSFVSSSSVSAAPDVDSVACSSAWSVIGLEVSLLSALVGLVALGLTDNFGGLAGGLSWTFSLFALLLAAAAAGVALAGGAAASAALGIFAAAISGIGIILGIVALRGAVGQAKIAGAVGTGVGSVSMFVAIVPARMCL